MATASSSNVNALLESAVQNQALTPAAAQAIAIVDVGQQIQNAMGVNVDDVGQAEVILVALLIDDSGSIRFVKGNTEAVREGHSLVLDAMIQSKQQDNILVLTQFLNGGVISPFGSINNTVRLDTHNYDPMGGTPLYDQTAALLGAVAVKMQEFDNAGIHARAVVLIVSDGNDEGSRKLNSPSKVSPIVRDMLKSENCIIAAMGISDGSTDFKQVFGEMGIPDEWILTPQNDPRSIRSAFQLFSQSSSKAVQNAQSFSQVALGGGFANP